MAGGGGGTDPAMARAISMIEAVERYSNCVPPKNLRWATQRDLGLESLDLRTMPRCSKTEFEHPKCQTLPYDIDDKIRWVRGWSFRQAEPRWIPAVSVWLHLSPQARGERFTLPISTGSAAHTDLAKAVVNGLCEVVERDAISLTWLQMLPLPEIDFSDAPPDVKLTVESANSGATIHRFFDATTDVGIPTIYCVDTAPQSTSMRHVVMCATDLDPGRAVIKIAREIASSRIALEHGQHAPMEVDDFVDVFHGAQYMGHADRSMAFDFLLRQPREVRKFGDIPSFADLTPESELRLVLARLESVSASAFAVDITTSEARSVGIHVVKTIIPELMPLSFAHRSRFLAHPRLFEAPLKLGYHSREEHHLNPFPQPFA
ncbi:YcaO-like family protein [Herbiconiux sp. P16]|uniref:YcaO-like family protein n=1 Tax=Herbiconiux wuyangfengii TaxID=3342794 RepID=UPI003CF3FAF9